MLYNLIVKGAQQAGFDSQARNAVHAVAVVELRSKATELSNAISWNKIYECFLEYKKQANHVCTLSH